MSLIKFESPNSIRLELLRHSAIQVTEWVNQQGRVNVCLLFSPMPLQGNTGTKTIHQARLSSVSSLNIPNWAGHFNSVGFKFRMHKQRRVIDLTHRIAVKTACFHTQKASAWRLENMEALYMLTVTTGRAVSFVLPLSHSPHHDFFNCWEPLQKTPAIPFSLFGANSGLSTVVLLNWALCWSMGRWPQRCLKSSGSFTEQCRYVLWLSTLAIKN